MPTACTCGTTPPTRAHFGRHIYLLKWLLKHFCTSASWLCGLCQIEHQQLVSESQKNAGRNCVEVFATPGASLGVTGYATRASLMGQPSSWTTTPSHHTLGASGSLQQESKRRWLVRSSKCQVPCNKTDSRSLITESRGHSNAKNIRLLDCLKIAERPDGKLVRQAGIKHGYVQTSRSRTCAQQPTQAQADRSRRTAAQDSAGGGHLLECLLQLAGVAALVQHAQPVLCHTSNVLYCVLAYGTG